ncbi:MAG: hypothetical protein WBM06_24340, partial [Pseudolabrys sp.]
SLERRSISVEEFAAARSQQNSRLFHAAAVFKLDQLVGDGVFPNRQMRATPPPGLRVGVTARCLRDPGEELLCQRVRGVLHGETKI